MSFQCIFSIWCRFSSKVTCFSFLFPESFVTRCSPATAFFSSSYFLNSSGCFRRCATRLVVVNDFVVCPPLEILVLQIMQDACRSLLPAEKNCHICDRLFDMIVRPPCHVHSFAYVRNRPYLDYFDRYQFSTDTRVSADSD